MADIINFSEENLDICLLCKNQIQYVRWKDCESIFNLFSKNLRKFMGRDRVEEIFSSIPLHTEDTKIYSVFRDEIEKYKKTERKWVPRRQRIESRENSRQRDIFSFYNGNPNKYLDLGGGDGKISSAIGNYLSLSGEEIICADVNSWWDENRSENENITYLKITEGEKLPFKDGEFGLITCFQSLHHIKDEKFVISELYRILEPGGHIIIREHDCDSEFMKILIDIEHCIFENVLKIPSEDFIKNYYGNYKSAIEWSKLFWNQGLSFCSNKRYKKPRINPTKYYYAMYSKN